MCINLVDTCNRKYYQVQIDTLITNYVIHNSINSDVHQNKHNLSSMSSCWYIFVVQTSLNCPRAGIQKPLNCPRAGARFNTWLTYALVVSNVSLMFWYLLYISVVQR